MNQYFDINRGGRRNSNRCESSFSNAADAANGTASLALRRSKTTHDFRKNIVQKQDVVDSKNNVIIEKWFNKAAVSEQKVVYDFIENLYNNAKEIEKQEKEREKQRAILLQQQQQQQQQIEESKKAPEKKTIDDILENIRPYRRNPYRRRAYYDDKMQDEIEKAKARPKENLNEILMHTNIADPKFKYFSAPAAAAVVKKPSVELPEIVKKPHKFYTDTWRMFMECDPVQKTPPKSFVLAKRLQV